MKKIQIVCSGIVLVVISSLAQAVELSLNTSDGRSGELKDGTKVATGRIICRGTYTSFHIWMNSRQMGNILVTILYWADMTVIMKCGLGWMAQDGCHR